MVLCAMCVFCSHVKESSSDVIEEVSRLKEKYTKQLRESVRVKTEVSVLCRSNNRSSISV